MKNKPSSGLGRPVKSFLKFLILTAACVALAWAVVFPLWKFASAAPKLYTAIILFLCAAFLLFLIVRAIIRGGAKKSIGIVVTVALVVAGLWLFVHFIINGRRIFALISLAAAILILIFVRFILNRIFYEK